MTIDEVALPEMDGESVLRLEDEFKTTLQSLVGGEGCSVYALRDLFLKMHRALLASQANERRLMKTCRELNKEIVANSSKVKDALKLSQEDQNIIGQLKSEIDKAWKNSDQAEDQNCRARETIQSLKGEIVHLSEMAERGNAGGGGGGGNQSAMLEEMEQLKELMMVKDIEIGKLKEDVAAGEARINELMEVKNADDAKIDELAMEIQLLKNEMMRDGKKRQRIEAELQTTQEILAAKEDELRVAYGNLEKEMNNNNAKEEEIRNLKANLETKRKEEKKMRESMANMQAEMEALKQELTDVRAENESVLSRMRTAVEEMAMLRGEIAKLKKMIEALTKKLRATEEMLEQSQKERDALNGKIGSLNVEIENGKKEYEKLDKEFGDMRREKDKMGDRMIKQEAAMTKMQGNLRECLQTRKEMDKQIDKFKNDMKQTRVQIHSLEKDRDRLIGISGEKDARIVKEVETIKLLELQMFDYKKQVTENESKIRQQENLYESTRQEKNNLAKTLMETKDRLNQYLRKCELLYQEADRMKEELARENRRYDDLTSRLRFCELEKNKISSELNKMKLEFEDCQVKLKASDDSLKYAHKSLEEKELERQRQRKEFDRLVSERDLIGTQLVRRNDEMACLNEKLKLQQTRMGCGEMHYNARVNENKVLAREVKELERKKKVLEDQCADRESQHREVCRLETELNAERLRVKRLEDLVETPQNIHRFRILAATEPTTNELLERIDTLQRRLIRKTEEVEHKERSLEDLERLVDEQGRMIRRLPGPQDAEKLAAANRTIRKKTSNNQAMLGELAVWRAKAVQDAEEKQQLEMKANENRTEYLRMKKDYQKLEEKLRSSGRWDGSKGFGQKCDESSTKFVKLPKIDK